MTFSTIAFFILLGSMIAQIVNLLIERKIFIFISMVFMALSAILLLIDFVTRSITMNFVSLTNLYESLIFYSAVTLIIVFVYTLLAGKKALQPIIFGTTMIAFALLSLASSPIVPKEINPPIPALQSYWLVLHVSFAFIGEAFFALSFVTSIFYLLARDEVKKKEFEKLTIKSISIGYPIFTAGAILFGAIWAYYAWGRFWGWDPKETWALITWFTYTLFLHLRLIKKAQGKVAMIISIIGFLFTLFTFFGVNYLLSGLHSYT
ncbi:MAG: cytochrome c biogenesis protein CcsA [Spirochaetales bacterium]|nr:cytochrome c biogenesis protein CcsA [Spirochaetales bacterium]